MRQCVIEITLVFKRVNHETIATLETSGVCGATHGCWNGQSKTMVPTSYNNYSLPFNELHNNLIVMFDVISCNTWNQAATLPTLNTSVIKEKIPDEMRLGTRFALGGADYVSRWQKHPLSPQILCSTRTVRQDWQWRQHHSTIAFVWTYCRPIYFSLFLLSKVDLNLETCRNWDTFTLFASRGVPTASRLH